MQEGCAPPNAYPSLQLRAHEVPPFKYWPFVQAAGRSAPLKGADMPATAHWPVQTKVASLLGAAKPLPVQESVKPVAVFVVL